MQFLASVKLNNFQRLQCIFQNEMLFDLHLLAKSQEKNFDRGNECKSKSFKMLGNRNLGSAQE